MGLGLAVAIGQAEVCVRRSRTWMGRAGGWPFNLRFLNSGMYFSTGSSKASLPSSTRIAAATAVMGLDMEAIQKRSSVCIFRVPSVVPTAARWRILSLVATSVTMPETVGPINELLHFRRDGVEGAGGPEGQGRRKNRQEGNPLEEGGVHVSYL